jgi:hypothetical protein
MLGPSCKNVGLVGKEEGAFPDKYTMPWNASFYSGARLEGPRTVSSKHENVEVQNKMTVATFCGRRRCRSCLPLLRAPVSPQALLHSINNRGATTISANVLFRKHITC